MESNGTAWCIGCCAFREACVVPAPVLQTAATLHDQTEQLNKVVDDLDEIEFTMKKATKIIADIGKGIMTDRWVKHASPAAVAATDCSGTAGC